MLKTLLHKQLLEIFRSYFYNPKTNKARSKGAVAAYMVLFVVLMVGILGGMFGFLAYAICRPLAEAGMGWLYYLLFTLMAVFLGVFGSVFNTFAGLYQAKDNDLLLSMPIPVRYILTARLLGVYLMGLMYSGTVLLPAILVYWILCPLSAASIVGGLMLLVLVSAADLLLSCVLGYVVAKITQKLKNKSFITVLVSLVFFGVYYLVYFKANDLIAALVENAAVYGAKIQGSAWLLYQLGQIGTGAPLAILLWTAILGVLLGLTLWVLARSFLKLATAANKVERIKEKKTPLQAQKPAAALRRKEFGRFFASPNYMLNCGMGLLMLPIAAVALLIKGHVVREALVELMGSADQATVLLGAGLCLLATMNDMAAPSVSLEGKSLWLLQSLPIEPWQVLRAKLSVQLILTGLPLLLGIASVWIVLRPSFLTGLLTGVLVLLVMCLFTAFDLLIGLKNPNLHWTSEIVPIKQSMSVMVALLGGWAYAIVLGVGYLLLSSLLGAPLFLGMASLLTGGLTLWAYRWLRTRGSQLFARL